MLDSSRRRLLLAAAALPAACATPPYLPPPAAAVPAPRVRAGDRWRYELRNGYNGLLTGSVLYRVAEASPRLRIEATDGNGVRLPDEVYASPWQVVQETTFDLVQVYEAPVPIVPEPIAIGPSLRSALYYTVPEYRPRRFWWDQTIRGLGWQRLATPMGELDCLLVERTVNFQHADIFRTLSYRTERLWYAPQVNRWARREWTGQYLMNGGRRTWYREDFPIWTLVEYLPTPTAGS